MTVSELVLLLPPVAFRLLYCPTLTSKRHLLQWASSEPSLICLSAAAQIPAALWLHLQANMCFSSASNENPLCTERLATQIPSELWLHLQFNMYMSYASGDKPLLPCCSWHALFSLFLEFSWHFSVAQTACLFALSKFQKYISSFNTCKWSPNRLGDHGSFL